MPKTKARKVAKKVPEPATVWPPGGPPMMAGLPEVGICFEPPPFPVSCPVCRFDVESPFHILYCPSIQES